ncbi:hypothetical protein LX36DRAFT_339302 [Colletotrichum falcatum]|nr:hypothetical protein LX36DRAFT_339302 [Colletotrichum falcatum]
MRTSPYVVALRSSWAIPSPSFSFRIPELHVSFGLPNPSRTWEGNGMLLHRAKQKKKKKKREREKRKRQGQDFDTNPSSSTCPPTLDRITNWNRAAAIGLLLVNSTVPSYPFVGYLLGSVFPPLGHQVRLHYVPPPFQSERLMS